MITIEEIMGYKPCRDYPRERVEELWTGREALSPREVAELEIPACNRVWALCYCLASRNLNAVVAFAQGCAERAAEEAAEEAARASAEASAYAAEARGWAAREWAARAWAAEALKWTAYAADWAVRAAYWESNTAAVAAEQQRQIDELVGALETCK